MDNDNFYKILVAFFITIIILFALFFACEKIYAYDCSKVQIKGMDTQELQAIIDDIGNDILLEVFGINKQKINYGKVQDWLEVVETRRRLEKIIKQVVNNNELWTKKQAYVWQYGNGEKPAPITFKECIETEDCYYFYSDYDKNNKNICKSYLDTFLKINKKYVDAIKVQWLYRDIICKEQIITNYKGIERKEIDGQKQITMFQEMMGMRG